MVDGLMSRGHEVTVMTPDYGGNQPSEANVMRIKPTFSSGNAAFVPSVYGMMPQADVLHLHYPFFGGAETAAYYAYRHPNTKFVVTYHMDTVGSGVKKMFFQTYKALCLSAILSQARAVTVSSLDYAATGALAPMLPRLPVSELPFGVDGRFVPASRSNDASGPLRLLFVGGLDTAHYFKGLHILFAALKGLSEPQRKSVTLDIVGDGDAKSGFESLAAETGMGEQVRFRGSLSETDLVTAYQQADLTVLPSIDRSEAYGLVLLESMACGTPVVASRLAGVRTLVEEGQTGFLVEPGDPLALRNRLSACIESPSLLPAMRENAARGIEERHRWPCIIEQLEALYLSA
jgi:glycosyltransferase involved in cell wall biosynthesis